MSPAQVDSATPQFIPDSFHFADYATAGISSSSEDVPQLGHLRCLRGRYPVGALHHRRPRDHEDALPRAGRDHVDVRGLALHPGRHHRDPGLCRHERVRLINTYPGLIIPIAAQTGFGTLLFRQYIVTMPEELSTPHEWTAPVGGFAPSSGRAARSSRHRRLPRDLGDHGVEHVPLAAARGNSPHVEVLSEVVAAIGQGDTSATRHPPQLYAATVITVLPMVIAFYSSSPRSTRPVRSGVE